LFVVFSGLPGTGKSTLAEAVGRALNIPVFAKDWLESSLTRIGIHQVTIDGETKPLGYGGYELLTMLAERQLQLGQSVIVDSVASTTTIRDRWRNLAHQYNVQWRVIECVCSDQALHRTRLVSRQRNIPGWPELSWNEVERVSSYYALWSEPHLILDATVDATQNLTEALAYLDSR